MNYLEALYLAEQQIGERGTRKTWVSKNPVTGEIAQITLVTRKKKDKDNYFLFNIIDNDNIELVNSWHNSYIEDDNIKIKDLGL
jgi:hypothetical protein